MTAFFDASLDDLTSWDIERPFAFPSPHYNKYADHDADADSNTQPARTAAVLVHVPKPTLQDLQQRDDTATFTPEEWAIYYGPDYRGPRRCMCVCVPGAKHAKHPRIRVIDDCRCHAGKARSRAAAPVVAVEEDSEDPSDFVVDPDYYSVKRVVGHKGVGAKRKYLVQWKNSWLKREDFAAPKLVKAYENGLLTKRRRTKTVVVVESSSSSSESSSSEDESSSSAESSSSEEEEEKKEEKPARKRQRRGGK